MGADTVRVVSDGGGFTKEALVTSQPPKVNKERDEHLSPEDRVCPPCDSETLGQALKDLGKRSAKLAGNGAASIATSAVATVSAVMLLGSGLVSGFLLGAAGGFITGALGDKDSLGIFKFGALTHKKVQEKTHSRILATVAGALTGLVGDGLNGAVYVASKAMEKFDWKAQWNILKEIWSQ